MLGNTTIVLILLTFGYYILPLGTFWQDQSELLRFGVGVLAFVVLGKVLVLHLRHTKRTEETVYLRIQWLLSALYLLVLLFALAYAFIAEHYPHDFVGISDRTNALYFSVTVVSTVGFGDIYPTAKVPQLIVSAQMIFDLIYLGTALRVLSAFRSSDRPST